MGHFGWCEEEEKNRLLDRSTLAISLAADPFLGLLLSYFNNLFNDFTL